MPGRSHGGGLHLDGEHVAAVFPWHIVVGEELAIESIGASLLRVLPRLEGTRLGDAFRASPDAEALDGARLRASGDRRWALRAVEAPTLVVSGRFVPTVDGRLFFLGSAPEALPGDDEAGRSELRLRTTLRQLEAARTNLEREKVERERMADELRLSHRLEAVGQLAAGVAHEINTPIQYVGDSVAFLHESYENLARLDPWLRQAIVELRARGDDTTANAIAAAYVEVDAEYFHAQVPKAFARTFDGLEQVANIVRAMKAFAHPGTDDRALADVNEALASTLAVARNEFRYVADVETVLAADLPLVPCYIAELNQVFLNLVVNAAHAVGEAVAGTARRGHVQVSTRREGEHVVVEISDDGVGIPEAIKDRIFDPFFTTKPVGKGTGQGLTIVRAIVAKHRGRIEVSSTPGVGTTFTMTLPLREELVEP